uniref:Putative septin 5b n=1 Tax=Ixodes ricinus TaxID=34613 RepID=A0A0K8R3R2_IXORI
MYRSMERQLSSQLTASPKPGVSTTVSRSRTPFSSISMVLRSICTVLSILSSAFGSLRSSYKSVRKRLLISVDFPRPDSPTTIRVKSKPLLTDLRCTCSGRVAKPISPSDGHGECRKSVLGISALFVPASDALGVRVSVRAGG